jgi:hypothetical protein
LAGLTAGLARDSPASSRGAGRGLAATALGGTLGLLLLIAMIAGLGSPTAGSRGEATSPRAGGGSLLARRDIPPALLLLYEQAARRYSLDWAVLAAIGKVECDHGRDPDPACRIAGSVNGAGAGGPMQFIASTWARYGVDGDGDGVANRWSAADAIYSAANYLRDSGARGDVARAILAYNHSRAYLAEVERWAARYRGSAAGDDSSDSTGDDRFEGSEQTPTSVILVAGARAQLSAANGHVALIPAAAPPVVRALVVAGNELQDLPYGPDGHPDPRGAADEDCSSAVNYVLYRAGIRPIEEIVEDNPLAQDYLRWGDPGPGRWVTVFATVRPTPHVFIVIAGLRLDTSHRGTDIGPNRQQDGPRWRLLDHIPGWARWTVRHPPGL